MQDSSFRLSAGFFQRDVLTVSPELLGKKLIRRYPNGFIQHYTITELEAYCGVTDLACHASKGRTKRTEILYHNGGVVYMYLIYGMYWMLNIVTSIEGDPQAILIRGVEDTEGPGRIGKLLQLDKSFYGEDLSTSQRLWVENVPAIAPADIITTPRIGIDYAGEWAHKPWRFVLL
ncbi:MAG: DNA-3-methyladenine glycosylase [Prevotellaceae bacterium]|jgi:DNA-3-methyladenine glycosylase|nr:DNA-3-methyladenine glycosylase [Prevotellaceae bacterium]